MEAPEGFRLVRAGPADRERVVSLARLAFFPDEPMNVALGRTEGPASTQDMPFVTVLGQGISLIAECAHTGEIFGICINNFITPEALEKKTRREAQDETQDEVLREMIRVLGGAWRSADLWSHTEARHGMEVRIMAVAPSVRGRGLARAMLQESLHLAQHELHLPLAAIMCTSAYTARLAEQADMRLIYALPYGDTGLSMLPPPAHHQIGVYILEFHD